MAVPTLSWRPLLAVLTLNIVIPTMLSASPGRSAPRQIVIARKDISYSATLANGRRIGCLIKKKRLIPGKVSKRGKKFLPARNRITPVLQRLRATLAKTTRKKVKKRLRRRIKKQTSLLRQQSAACRSAAGITPQSKPALVACSLEPYKGPVTETEVRYLLEKAAFGLSEKEFPLIALAAQQGLKATVREIMRPREEDPGVMNRVLDWRDGLLENSDDILRGGSRKMQFSGMRNALLDLHINTNNPYREKLAIFLWSIWTAADDVLNQSNQRILMWNYIDLLRKAAYNPDMIRLGLDVTITPLMLIYLNGDQNIALAPNENYGRELFELFSTGPEDLDGNPNYSEMGDIVEISKALTGWTVIEKEIPDPASPTRTKKVWRAVESPADHSPGFKQLFAGKSYAVAIDTYEDAVRAVFQHPNAAAYYAEEILKEYVTREPPRCLIENFARKIRAANFQLDGPMETLLTSKAFFHNAYVNSIAKHSVEFVVEFIRTLGIPVSINEIRGLLDGDLNIGLTRAPDVFWWSHDVWSSAPVTLAKANAITRILRNTRAQRGEEEVQEDDWLPAEVCPPAPKANEQDLLTHVMHRMGVSLPTEPIRQQLLFYARNSRKSDGTFTTNSYDNQSERAQRRKCLGLYALAALTPDFLHK